MRSLLWLALTLCAACGSEKAKTPKSDASIPEPILPSAAPVASATPTPAWVSELPDVAPNAVAGERVWATIPEPGNLPTVGVYTLEGVYDGLCRLTSATGQGVDGVPSALVHRAAKRGRVHEGMVVLFHTVSTPAMIGRVNKLVPGGEITVSYDWAGATREAAVDHAEPPIDGIRPMAFVSFPKSGRLSRGLLVALSPERAWVRSASGHVEVHPRPAIGALPIKAEARAIGARVRVFGWATGFRTGTVMGISEPHLRFAVKVDDTGAIQRYFFSTIFPI